MWLVMGAERTADPGSDPSRYLNQNFWYQNVRPGAPVTVWYAGFSEFRPADAAGMADTLVEGDPHVSSVMLAHLPGGGAAGTRHAVPRGDGTAQATGDAAYLRDVFPDALPPDSSVGDGVYPSAYDYVPCGVAEATHLMASWTVNGLPSGIDLGLVARGTYNWDSVHGLHGDYVARDGNGQLSYWRFPWADDPGIAAEAEIAYYKATFPDSPKEGHDRALLEIVPEFGYYVSDVVVTCCFRGDAYHGCSIYNTGHAFQRSFRYDGGGAAASLELDSEAFCHASGASRYYVMIRTQPIPGQVLVQYDPGEVAAVGTGIGFGADDGWLSESRGSRSTRRLTEVSDEIVPEGAAWAEEGLAYTVDAVEPGVLDELGRDGWTFTGWELEYYGDASLKDRTSSSRRAFWAVAVS